jgi:6-phosphogluconolactonase (cycloisomerase 2 family)
MRKLTVVAATGGAVLAAALCGSPAYASTSPASTQHASQAASTEGPVFVQTDNLSGNSVVAYDAGANGTLTQAATYATGGLGGQLGGSVTDHLGSAGSLTYDPQHNLLFAVNAGSNTITVFSVSGDKLTREQVISSGGDFPVSVAANDGIVYVLNARDGGSLQGYAVNGTQLDLISSWHRDLGLSTSGSPEFVNTPGEVLFTFNGLGLIVTTKNASNALDVFGVVGSGDLSATPVVDSLPGTLPFSATFDLSGELIVAEAGANAISSFSLNSDGTLTAVGKTPTGQSTSCWVVSDGYADFIANNGSGTISGFDDNPGGALTALGNTPTDSGTTDPVVSPDGHYLYVQTGAGGIVDEFAVNANDSLTKIGSVTVPGDVGGQGIVVG